MKALTVTATGQQFPGSTIIEYATLWTVDYVVYPKSVIGEATIQDYVPPPAPLPTQAEYTEALEAMYDAKAQEKNYDTRYTCALRAGYPSAFQAEGTAFGEWMDNCNVTAYGIMAQVQQGLIPQPTIGELLAMMPVLVWP